MLVGGRQDERGLEVLGVDAIESGDEDGLDRAVAWGAGVERADAGGVESVGAVAFAEADEAEAGAVALLGVREALEELLDEEPDSRAEARAPRDEAGGRPLDVALVGLGAVRGVGGEAALERTAGVGRHAAAVMQDLDGGRGQADVDLFVDEAVGDAVGVALDADVVVDVDAGVFPGGVLVARRGERAQGGPLKGLEEGAAAPGELLKRAGVEGAALRGERRIEVGETEEGLVTQRREDPALDELDAGLDLRLVAGFARTGRQDRGAVVPRQILIGGVEHGLVEAGVLDASPQIVGDGQRGLSAGPHNVKEGV